MSVQQTLDDELSNLATFYELGSYICADLDLDEVLTRISWAVVNLMQTEASSIITVDEANNQLTFEAAYGGAAAKLSKFSFPRDENSIAGWVVLNGQPKIINNPHNNPHFSGNIDRDTQFTTRNLLCVPMIARGKIIGCIEVLNKKPGAISDLVIDFNDLDMVRLSAMASQAAVAIDNARQYQRVESAIGELNASYYQCLLFLSDTIDLRDSNTAGHCRRVVKYTRNLAEHLGISDPAQLTDIEYGALLHDVGKLRIEDRILRKPGPLDDDEWKIMRMHPQYGRDGLSQIKFLWRALPIILYHHEHWDGSGYPEGLAGEYIPIEARIFSVCDAFDAITSERPYKKAMIYTEAHDYFMRERGRIYDPKVVDTFLALGESHWARLLEEVGSSPSLNELFAGRFLLNPNGTA